MSVEERCAWFNSMPKGDFPRPSWIAAELTNMLYATGEDRLSKDALKDILLACAKDSANGQDDPKPIPEVLLCFCV